MNTLVLLVNSTPPTLQIIAENSGHELGQIVESDGRKLTIVPLEGSPLAGVKPGPYTDRGDAMAAISARLSGTCLHARSKAMG